MKCLTNLSFQYNFYLEYHVASTQNILYRFANCRYVNDNHDNLICLIEA